VNGQAVDLAAVNGEPRGDAGVAHGARLLAFTEAVLGRDEQALADHRTALRDAVSAASFVDVCAVIGAFNVVDRIADATGIALDEPLVMMSGAVRGELDLARFASAANTPGAR